MTRSALSRIAPLVGTLLLHGCASFHPTPMHTDKVDEHFAEREATKARAVFLFENPALTATDRRKTYPIRIRFSCQARAAAEDPLNCATLATNICRYYGFDRGNAPCHKPENDHHAECKGDWIECFDERVD